MGDSRKYLGGGSSLRNERNEEMIVPKPESLDYDYACDTLYNQQDNVASSSGSKVRLLLIDMGFSPLLIEKAIEEKGEDNVELLLETLIEHSDNQKSKSQSSDSLNNAYVEKDMSSFPEISGLTQPKQGSAFGPKQNLLLFNKLSQEPGIPNEADDKRASLLTMKFPVNLVDFALDKLGKYSPIDELVDFIVAAQIAEKYEEESEESLDGAENYREESDDKPVVAKRKVEVTDDLLFETMDKTLHLLEMGFSDNEVSLAIEKLGSKVQISVLADTIFTGDVPGDCLKRDEKSLITPETSRACPSKNWRFVGMGTEDDSRHSSSGTSNIKSESSASGLDFLSLPINGIETFDDTWKGTRPKEEDGYAYPDAITQSMYAEFSENDNRGKRAKLEYMGGSSSFLEPTWPEEDFDSKTNPSGMPKAVGSHLPRSLGKEAEKRPYFFYGNFANISHHWWAKISQFLFAVQPEFVNTRSFSALSRKEGYVHNLPTENRSYVLLKPLTTIQEALPQTKKWWPSWDTRKQLSNVSHETSGVAQLCDRLGNLIFESRGLLSAQQQQFILRHCHMSNLLWVGPNILSPMEPEHLERVLGYQVNHTQPGGISLIERLKLLEYCFQSDTLAYHLSPLKYLFPSGLTLLSVFSGIGGTEVALARLGIYLKGVVSIEPSELSRRVLKKWWQSSGQNGELVQIEGIQTLTSKKLEILMERFGGFDLVVCQNPCTPPNLSRESSKISSDGKSQQDFDFALFNEFVRVLQRVRTLMEKS